MVGFLQADKESNSYMRLGSLLALCNAILLQWYGTVTGKVPLDTMIAIIPWLVAGFVPKAIQSFAESWPQVVASRVSTMPHTVEASTDVDIAAKPK